MPFLNLTFAFRNLTFAFVSFLDLIILFGRFGANMDTVLPKVAYLLEEATAAARWGGYIPVIVVSSAGWHLHFPCIGRRNSSDKRARTRRPCFRRRAVAGWDLASWSATAMNESREIR